MFNCVCKGKILIYTRPLSNLAEDRKIIEQYNLNYIELSLTEIEYNKLEKDEINKFQNFIVTSQNAITDYLKNLDVSSRFYCVGTKAGVKLNKIGFKNIFNLGNDINEFEESFVSLANKENEYLYLRGQDITTDLAKNFSERGFKVQDQIIYHSVNRKILSEDAINFLHMPGEKYVILLSSKTAEVFLDLIDTYEIKNILNNLKFLCLSHKIASILYDEVDKNNIIVSNHPNFYDLVKSI